MAKCHLPQSMTKIYGQNFKKNVIDDGQWQKNCHLLKGIYPKKTGTDVYGGDNSAMVDKNVGFYGTDIGEAKVVDKNVDYYGT